MVTNTRIRYPSVFRSSGTPFGPCNQPRVRSDISNCRVIPLPRIAVSLVDRITPPHSDLSARYNVQRITICDMLHWYPASCDIHDSHDEHLFERMPSTIQFPTLFTITVPITNHIVMGKDKAVILTKSNWTRCFAICSMRTRERTQDPREHYL